MKILDEFEFVYFGTENFSHLAHWTKSTGHLSKIQARMIQTTAQLIAFKSLRNALQNKTNLHEPTNSEVRKSDGRKKWAKKWFSRKMLSIGFSIIT